MTPDLAAPDDSVTLDGTGLAANHQYFVTIGLPGQSLPLPEMSDAGGRFEGAYKIPIVNAPPGSYPFCLYSTEAGWPPQAPPIAWATLTVVAPAPLRAAARLMVTPARVKPGAYVSVSGSGFPPGHSFWVTIPKGLPAASMPIPETADGQGNLGPVSTPVGGAPPGTYQFCVRDSTVCATLTVTS